MIDRCRDKVSVGLCGHVNHSCFPQDLDPHGICPGLPDVAYCPAANSLLPVFSSGILGDCCWSLGQQPAHAFCWLISRSGPQFTE